MSLDRVVVFDKASVALLEREDGSRYWRIRYVDEKTVDIEVRGHPEAGPKGYDLPDGHIDGHLPYRKWHHTHETPRRTP